jgi:hypothetical protein
MTPNTLYLVMFDGEVEVLFDARPVVSNGMLCCLDARGREVRNYSSETVLIYGFSERIKDFAAALLDE